MSTKKGTPDHLTYPVIIIIIIIIIAIITISVFNIIKSLAIIRRHRGAQHITINTSITDNKQISYNGSGAYSCLNPRSTAPIRSDRCSFFYRLNESTTQQLAVNSYT
ncbi:hypothetical protein LSH36_145g05000 [Paralvinella palmiformis]|uniref:Uncharacterized protein n=1 Tax=Paralvinella palmiformis TaxID=53620 RepID=A0AAD9JV22_9ANNE|nr:hypothetical protein LSH36_145g05000 [Paralvinella palmiformis]